MLEIVGIYGGAKMPPIEEVFWCADARLW